jgi:hypothetical protein
MRLRDSVCVLALLWSSAGLRADVTVRYEFSEHANLPPGFAVHDRYQDGHEMTIRVKGNRGLLTMGHFTTIVDADLHQVTVLNLITKTFTTLPLGEFIADNQFPPPWTFRPTDRVETIHGVRAQVWQSMPTGPFRDEFSREAWLPADRVPAIEELARFRRPYARAANFTPAVLSPAIGGADWIEEMIKELLRGSFVLRYRVMGGGLETAQELVELSSDAIEDSAFRPPSNFKEMPFTEVLKESLSPAPKVSAAPTRSLRATLVDGVISYTSEDGTRKRVEVGKRCSDLWVAPDESSFAFIAMERSHGFQHDGEPFIVASSIYIARKSDRFGPVRLPVTSVKAANSDWEVFQRPSISPDGTTVFYAAPVYNSSSLIFAYNVETKTNRQFGSGIDYCPIWTGQDSGSILMWQRNFVGGDQVPGYKMECFVGAPGQKERPTSCAEFDSGFKFGAACTLPLR